MISLQYWIRPTVYGSLKADLEGQNSDLRSCQNSEFHLGRLIFKINTNHCASNLEHSTEVGQECFGGAL